MSITRQIILYSLFTIGVGVAFLVVLFPSEEISGFLASKVQTLKPGWRLDIESAAPAFPFSLSLKNVDLLSPGDLTVSAERIKLTPNVLTLFGKTPAVSYKGDMYSGVISGKAVFTKDDRQALSELNGNIKGIRMDKIAALKQVTQHTVTGSLNGEFTFAGDGQKRSGNTMLTVSPCAVTLAQPVFNVKQLTFSGINAKLTLQGGEIVQVQELTAKGPDLNGKASGNIHLKDILPDSALQLRGTITPHPAFISKLGGGMMAMLFKKNNKGGGLPFSVRGTLQKPSFSMK